MEHNLNKDELVFFYELLYKYEHESHAGFQDEKVIERLGNTVVLDNEHEKGENISTVKENVLQFTPYQKNKCWAVLYHVRNAFAHGNISSVDNNSFKIQDFSDRDRRSKCNMLGVIEKEKFYELIRTIDETREPVRARKKKQHARNKKVKK